MIDVRTFFDRCQFFIQPLILKGLQKDSLEIRELFWYIKKENGVIGKIPKN